MTQPLNVLSLFAGIGGLDLGLERAGYRVVGQVELDPFCQKVLSKHWPEVPRHDDVRTAVDWWLAEPRPRVDVVCGGYPCQPDSLAGGRRGSTDNRWLWPEMARVVYALRPRFVIGENVMGHRTGGLRFVLRDLERLGYTATPGVVSASEMGAPHRRSRIFILAHAHELELGEQSWWVCGSDGTVEAVPGPDGRERHLANPECDLGQQCGLGDASEGAGGWHARGSRLGADELAYACGSRRRSGGSESCGADPAPGQDQDGAYVDRSGWWAAEPPLGRVAYGVPGRVDRLRGLGNAVVPQVAEFVGRMMMDMWVNIGRTEA